MDKVVVIIPVLNEEATITEVIKALQAQGLRHICVVDNGSSDRTPQIAKQAGAQVISEPRRGYGQACWSGMQTPMAQQAEWILFCDGDGSDDLSELPALWADHQNYEFMLGNRRGTVAGRSQLTPVQNFGNWLATRLIRWGWGHAYEDLGPLRLIRRQALDQLAMADRGFGWTVEMQAKAAEQGLRICERPVNYRPRQGGQSKISGTLKGSFQAGRIILTTLAQLYWRSHLAPYTAPLTQLKTNLRTHQTNQINQPNLTHKVFQRSLTLLSIVLLVAGSLWAVPYGDFLNQPEAVPLFWRGMGLMGLGFIATWGLNHITRRWFWLGAIAPRLILLAMHPGDDIWRYLWEGHLQTVGLNPYVLAPDAPALIPLRFDWWPLINHPDHAAIYPPVAQLGFRLLAAIAPSVLLFKSAFVAADLGLCWLLSRRFGYGPTLLYAWNPLVMYSFAGGGHYDSWFLLPLVAAWLWAEPEPPMAPGESAAQSGATAQARGKPLGPAGAYWKSAIAIGISIAVKWMSLPVLAFLAWQHRHRKRLAAGLLIAGLLPLGLMAMPFCQGQLFGPQLLGHPPSHLSCPILPLDSSFINYGRSAALVPTAIGHLWPASERMNGIYALPLAGILLWQFWRTRSAVTPAVGARGPATTAQQAKQSSPQWPLLRFHEHYLVALMLLSPIIHAWYFTWLVPFAVASRNWGTRLVSLSAFCYFGLPYSLATGGEWHLSTSQYWGLWGPFLLGLVITRPAPLSLKSNNLHQGCERTPKNLAPSKTGLSQAGTSEHGTSGKHLNGRHQTVRARHSSEQSLKKRENL